MKNLDIKQAQLSHSQNFLRNEKLVCDLVSKTSINSHDIVLEIGPGKGIITSCLAKVCQNVIAAEVDDSLFLQLKDMFSSVSNVKIYHQDFLYSNLPNCEYKVFSNIPFNITSDIMRKLFDGDKPPIDGYLIIQSEAAEKFGGFKSDTMISVLRKPYFMFDKIHNFKREDFGPRPSVDSVLLRIKKLDQPLVDDQNRELYADFITFGFASTKSNVKKTYENIFSHAQFTQLASENKFNLDAKPTDLSFAQWLALFNFFIENADNQRKQVVSGAYYDLLSRQSVLEKQHRTWVKK